MCETKRQPDPVKLEAAFHELLTYTVRYINDPALEPYVSCLLDVGDRMLSELQRADAGLAK